MAEQETGQHDEPDVLGKVLDAAGIVAALICAVIIVDLFTGGRVGRWLRGQAGQEGEPDDG